MRSSTSSSELLVSGWPARPRLPQVGRWMSTARNRFACAALRFRARILGRRLPWGLILALAIIVSARILSALLYPEPVARPRVRSKVTDLTVSRRPSVVFCGDSRLLTLRPSLVSEALGLPADQVINASDMGNYPDAALAVLREFRGRFAPRPVFVVSVLISQVDERSFWWEPDEYMWQASVAERWRLEGFRGVVRPVFLPERALWNDLVRLVRPVKHWDDAGCHASGPDANLARLGPVRLADQVEAYVQDRLSQAEIEGPRWQRFESIIEELARLPVQLVVVSPPTYPGVDQALTSRARAKWDLFRRKVASLCARCEVPLLFYDTHGQDGRDAAALYSDLIHLNTAGAEVWSRLVGRDLCLLMEQGRISLPAMVSRDRERHMAARPGEKLRGEHSRWRTAATGPGRPGAAVISHNAPGIPRPPLRGASVRRGPSGR